jgi:hypothetical protein
MMMDDRKKIIAAVTIGVNAYMGSQKKGAVFSALKGVSPTFRLNLWAVDGRQEMMQEKRMWQMRWFKK